MLVNEEKIITDTKKAFFSSDIQKEKYSSIKEFVDESSYYRLHTSPLVPLDIKINVDRFKNEIVQYKEYFEQWGNQHQELPRYGIALVNQDGKLKHNDPINGSLYEWNVSNPNDPILETDCTTPTKVMNMASLEPLQVFNNHWCRSNILYWKSGAEFKPHIDTLIPSPWIRLWGTTTNSIKLGFSKYNIIQEYQDVEPGRIYVIDTSLVHNAVCLNEEGYQFFLSVLPSCYSKVISLV